MAAASEGKEGLISHAALSFLQLFLSCPPRLFSANDSRPGSHTTLHTGLHYNASHSCEIVFLFHQGRTSACHLPLPPFPPPVSGNNL